MANLASTPISAAAPTALRFEYDVTDADMEAFYRHATASHPLWTAARKKVRETQRAFRFSAWLTGGALALIVAGFAAGIFHPSQTMFIVCGLCFLVCLFIAIKYNNGHLQSRIDKYILQLLADPSMDCYVGPHVFTASPEGLEYDHPVSVVRQRWSAVAWVEEAPAFLGVHGADGRCMVIPNRYLGDRRGEVAMQLRVWMTGAGGGDQRRIKTFLQTNTVACPQCAYQLRGSDGSKCPECGLWLHRWNVPAAFKRVSSMQQPLA